MVAVCPGDIPEPAAARRAGIDRARRASSSDVQLVGRDRELAAAARAVADAQGGTGRVLGVLGEAGIGKSALLGAVAAQARSAGFLAIEGRSVEHERDVPFGLAVWLLADELAMAALGLSQPPTRQDRVTHTYALVSHCVYGLTTEYTRRLVRQWL